MSLVINNQCDHLDLWVAILWEDHRCDGNPPPERNWAQTGWFKVPYFITLPPPYPGAPRLTYGGSREVLTGGLKKRHYYYVHARAWDGSKWVAGWGDTVPRDLPMYEFDECIWYLFDQPLERCWFLELYSPTENMTVNLHL